METISINIKGLNKSICQDSNLVWKEGNRFCMVISDGCGSVKLSHIGSNIIATEAVGYIKSLNSIENISAQNIISTIKKRAYRKTLKHMKELLRTTNMSRFEINKVAKHGAREALTTTLSLIFSIDGKTAVLLNIGDSLNLLVSKTGKTYLLHDKDNYERDNITCYINESTHSTLILKTFDMDSVKAVINSSDGVWPMLTSRVPISRDLYTYSPLDLKDFINQVELVPKGNEIKYRLKLAKFLEEKIASITRDDMSLNVLIFQ